MSRACLGLESISDDKFIIPFCMESQIILCASGRERIHRGRSSKVHNEKRGMMQCDEETT